ncbi:MAG: hypothetical protein EOL93_01770 [Epsilonproteobacteria bacterium]|nr:hypothetical protein [Campylobacterota bacterium]
MKCDDLLDMYIDEQEFMGEIEREYNNYKRSSNTIARNMMLSDLVPSGKFSIDDYIEYSMERL